MIELGNSLRAAREAKGYSVRQLSEITRMAPSTIQDLESENFSHIAAPIYGRGFIKLYCETVGLDPKTYIAEFMDIYTGNRQTFIQERSQPPPDTTLQPPAEAPDTPEPELDLFHQEAPVRTSVLSPLPDDDPPLSRYAAPIRQTHTLIDLRAYLRIGVLAACTLIVLTLIVCGIRAVYRATTPAGGSTSQEIAAVSTSKTKTVPPTPTKRTPQRIPSLYID